MAGIFDISGNDPLTVASREGTGFAKVLPVSEFKPADTSDLTKLRWLKYEEEKAKTAKYKENLSKLPKAIVATVDKNKEEIANDYNNLVNLYVESAKNGVDPTLDAGVAKATQALEQKAKEDELMAQQLQLYKDTFTKGGLKYNQDYFDKSLNTFLTAPTMEERKAALANNWLQENVDPYSNIKGFLPTVKGYGTISNQEADEAAKSYIMANDALIDASISQGKFKDDADALAQVTAQIKRLADYNQRPQGGGGINLNVGGNATRQGMALATFDPSAAYNYNDETNVIKFLDDNNKQLPPQQLTDNNGKEVYVQVEKLVKKNKGGGWSIVGKKAKRLTTQQFEAAKGKQGFNPDAYEQDSSTGEYISLTETEPIEIALKTNTSNYDLLSNAAGVDLFKMVQDRDEQKIGTRDPYGRSTKEGSQKQIKASNGKTNVGGIFGQ